MLTLGILYFIAGIVLIALGASIVVNYTERISVTLNISYFISSLLFIGIATSAPEIFISILSSLDQKSNIAIGNALGSNIANIFMVMGVLAMINDIAVEQWVLDTTLPLLMIITVATFGLIRVPFNRLSGLILYAFFILFMYELTFV